jgi:hypothetical protein
MKKKHLVEYHNLQRLKENDYTELSENARLNFGQNFEKPDTNIVYHDEKLFK